MSHHPSSLWIWLLLAIAIGVAANTFVKMTVALILGGPRFRAIAGGTLAAVMIAALLSIAVRAW